MTIDEELLSWQIAAARRLTQRRLASTPATSNGACTDSTWENQPFCTIEIERSLKTLERKRRHQLQSQLPKTARAMRNQFPLLANAFIHGHHFNGLWAVHDDAIAFSQWLRVHETIPMWIRQLAQWESLSVLFHRYRYCLRISHFAYEFDRWLAPRQCPPKPPNRSCLIVLTIRANTVGFSHWPLYRNRTKNLPGD